MTDDVLARLAAAIAARRTESADKSYTRQLLDGGPERCAKKLGEEAVETVIAGVSQSDEALRKEAADLIYHLLVLLEVRGVAFDGASTLIIGDSDNFCIREIDLSTDQVTTIAGTAGVAGHAVGVGLSAAFDKPHDVHFDAPTGDLFISEGTLLRRMYYR